MAGTEQSTDALGACGSRGTVVTHVRMRNAWLRMAVLNCALCPMVHMIIGHLPEINTPLQSIGTLKQFLKVFRFLFYRSLLNRHWEDCWVAA